MIQSFLNPLHYTGGQWGRVVGLLKGAKLTIGIETLPQTLIF